MLCVSLATGVGRESQNLLRGRRGAAVPKASGLCLRVSRGCSLSSSGIRSRLRDGTRVPLALPALPAPNTTQLGYCPISQDLFCGPPRGPSLRRHARSFRSKPALHPKVPGASPHQCACAAGRRHCHRSCDMVGFQSLCPWCALGRQPLEQGTLQLRQLAKLKDSN